MAPSQIGQQAIILIPFCHCHRRQTFEPVLFLAHPAPRIERRGGARNADRGSFLHIRAREFFASPKAPGSCPKQRPSSLCDGVRKERAVAAEAAPAAW